MKSLRLILVLPVLCWVFWVGNVLAENSSVGSFAQANQLYRSGQYSQAQKLYENLVLQDSRNGVYQYNLGNCYLRTKQIGKAILAYERALRDHPRDSDAKFNLNYVNSLLEYRIKDKRNWYLRMIESLTRSFTWDEILSLFLIAFAFFQISFVYVLVFRRGLAWGWIRKGFLVIVILSAGLVAVKSFSTQWMREAVITAPKAEVHYGPSQDDQVAFRLGEGLKVYVMSVGDNWSRIWLVNGDSGWIRNEQMELVTPSKRMT